MDRINFEDHVLIKRRRANQKMNVMGGMFKDEKKWGNRRMQFAFVTRSYVFFQVLEFTIV
jgi:hypothetical protein